MANYIVTNNPTFFQCIGDYLYCSIEEMAQMCAPFDALACDSETTGLSRRSGKLFCIQIGTGQDNFIVDMQEHNRPIRWREVEHILQGKHLVFHNATFDMGFFMDKGFYPDPFYIHDTMIASQIIYNGQKMIRHGFGFAMSRELGIEYDKTVQKDIGRIQLTEDKAIKYAFNDVDELLRLYTHLYDKCVKEGCVDTYNQRRQYTMILAYISNCGIPIDVGYWKEKMQVDQENMSKAKVEVEAYIYKHLSQFRNKQFDLFDVEAEKISINIDSPQQAIPVFQELGINTIDGQGKLSIKDDVIQKTPHEFVDLWLAYKKSSHRVSSFGQSILDCVCEEGRVYSDLKAILNTGRISCYNSKEPSHKIINSLNLPRDKETRDCFRAKEGYDMIVGDFDAQELVCSADISRDATQMAAVHNPDLDLHCAFCRLIHKPKLDDLSDDEIKAEYNDLRQEAKISNFALAFGGSAMTLHQNQNMPIEQAERVEEAYQELYAGVFEAAEKRLKIALEKGYIESALGFRLHLEYFDEYLEEKRIIDQWGNYQWSLYRKGKAQYRAIWDYKNFIQEPPLVDEEYPEGPRQEWEGEVPDVTDEESYYYYLDNKAFIRKHFQRVSAYKRLVMNNPVQSAAAHGTIAGTLNLFKRILKEGDIGKV
jgi:DNA polymerase-1